MFSKKGDVVSGYINKVIPSRTMEMTYLLSSVLVRLQWEPGTPGVQAPREVLGNQTSK